MSQKRSWSIIYTIVALGVLGFYLSQKGVPSIPEEIAKISRQMHVVVIEPSGKNRREGSPHLVLLGSLWLWAEPVPERSQQQSPYYRGAQSYRGGLPYEIPIKAFKPPPI